MRSNIGIQYYRSGSKKSQTFFYENGRKFEAWDINGNKESEQLFDAEGVENGPFRRFFPDGTLKTFIDYKDGMKCGDFVHYFDKDFLYQKGQYLNNAKTGLWKVFNGWSGGDNSYKQILYL